MASLIKISLLLAIAPIFVAAFCTCELNIASAVAPSVQSLYHAALAETMVDSPQSLSSLELAAGSSTTGQYQRYDNTGGSNYSTELEVSRGIWQIPFPWGHQRSTPNPLPYRVTAKSSTLQHPTVTYVLTVTAGEYFTAAPNLTQDGFTIQLLVSVIQSLVH